MATKSFCDKCNAETSGYECLVSRSRFPVEIRPAANQLFCVRCLIEGAKDIIQGHEDRRAKSERQNRADLNDLHESIFMPL